MEQTTPEKRHEFYMRFDKRMAILHGIDSLLIALEQWGNREEYNPTTLERELRGAYAILQNEQHLDNAAHPDCG